MQKILLVLVGLLFSTLGFSQGNPGGSGKGHAPKISGTIIGKVIDYNTHEPLEYTNVTIHKVQDSALVTGGITTRKGEFNLEKVPAGNYYIRINFIGFRDKFIPNINITKHQPFIDLGKVKLESMAEELQTFEVVAEKQGIEYKIDKKVINVDKFYTASSGTAVDVLENVPSVSVDAERNVSVRGSSSFTVLIDGRPTIMSAADALEQYPSTSIDKIEIITNPSAKYDPEGTAGIINIITKKQKMSGMAGIANVNIGMYNNYGADALLQFKREKVSWYVGVDWNNRGMVGHQTSYNATSDSITERIVGGEGDFNGKRTSGSFRAGVDLKLSNKNFLLIEGSVQASKRLRKNELDYKESVNDIVTDNYNSLNESSREGYNWNLSTDYQHKFKGDDKKLTVQATWSQSDGDEYSLNQLLGLSDNALRNGQRTTEVGPNTQGQVRVNYEHKVNDSIKFEIGYQGTYDASSDDFGTYIYDTLIKDYAPVDTAFRTSTYDRYIHAAYGIFSGTNKNFGYQFGLRTEYTNRDVSIVGNSMEYKINRLDFFPTIHFSYELSGKNQLMASYSRRIQRPRPWYLEPYIYARDPWNYRGGNPALAPSYIDAAEIGHQKRFEKFFISTEVYYRFTHDKVERIKQAYPAGGSGATLQIPENVGTDQSIGLEFMFKMPLTEWWEFSFMTNVYDYRVKGEYVDNYDGTVYNFNNSSTNYTLRLNQTFSVFEKTKVQFNGSYNSASVTAQGSRTGFVTFSAAIRTDVIDKKLAFNLSARNLFGTAIHEYKSAGSGFESISRFNMAGPVVTFTATYKLNNYREKRKKRMSGGESDMEG